MEVLHARPPESKAPPPGDTEQQEALRQRGEIPSHIAIIMDGNGRWAKKRGRNRFFGHTEGVASVRDIAEACAELGVQYLTLYTFSTENWQRPAIEVQSLMQLLVHTIRGERETLLKNNIRLNAIGDTGKLPPACRAQLEETIHATAGGDKMMLTLALSYSGRWELVNAMQAIARRIQAGELKPEEIDESTVEAHLCTVGMPDPALLIRTGGELRVSNYLLWQLAYTELYVTERFWPEFRRSNLYDAIRSYQDRERRFGRVVA